MSKVLIINASPRKKRTFAILEQINEKLTQAGHEITWVHLGEVKLDHCKGCEACIVKIKDCWQDDQANEILEQIASHDALVIGTPCYMFHISSLLKALIDRTACWFHHPDPRVVTKPFLLAQSSAGPMAASMKYARDMAVYWGMQPAGKITRLATQHDKKPVTDKEVQRFLWHLDHPASEYRPSLKQLVSYQLQKATAMAFVPIDRDHYIEQGWDKSIYYTNSRLGILRRLAAVVVYFVLNNGFKMAPK